MRGVILLLLALLGGLTAERAAAGPWARTPGEVFATISREIRKGTHWDALYAEYGWGERMTLVLDAGRSASGGWIAISALRVPLWTLGAHRFAASIGAGIEHVVYPDMPLDTDPQALIDLGLAPADYMMLQAGLSWGMSFDSRWGPGWAAVDGTLRQAVSANREERKLDATVGVNLSERRAVFGQMQYSDNRFDSAQIRLGVGWVEPFGPRAVEAGLGQRILNEGEADAKIGLWLTF